MFRFQYSMYPAAVCILANVKVFDHVGRFKVLDVKKTVSGRRFNDRLGIDGIENLPFPAGVEGGTSADRNMSQGRETRHESCWQSAPSPSLKTPRSAAQGQGQGEC